MSVNEYNLKFTQLSHYASEIVSDLKNKMSLFVHGLGWFSAKKEKKTMLIGNINVARLMTYIQQVEEDKLKDREKFCNKKNRTAGNGFS